MVFVTSSADAPVGASHIVRAGYDAIGPRYRERTRGNSLRARFVRQLLDRLSKDSLVLDLGCGPGDPATAIMAERCYVVGVDLSPVQLTLARRAVPTAAFVLGDMIQLGLRPGAFDAVVSFYAIGHVPSAFHPQVLRDIVRWLKPGGLLVANTPVTRGDGVNDWLGVQMFFGGIGAAPTLAALEDVGLRVESAEPIVEDEGGGHMATFLWVRARKPEA